MRAIDADKLQKQFNEKSINPNYRVNMHNIKSIISNAPTVEAIPKADYENRLKADMVAILDEFDLRLYEQYEDTDLIKVKYVRQAIQQKINALKENEDGKRKNM